MRGIAISLEARRSVSSARLPLGRNMLCALSHKMREGYFLVSYNNKVAMCELVKET